MMFTKILPTKSYKANRLSASMIERLFQLTSRTKLVFAQIIFCICFLQPLQAEVLLKQGAHINTGLYEEIVSDMQVKVLGGNVQIKRRWGEIYRTSFEFQVVSWQFNREWADLDLEYKYVNPNVAYLVDENEPPEVIKRNGYRYSQDKNNAAVYVYKHDKSLWIRRIETGYRWENRSGDWIEYDDEGKITKYGDKNNVTVSFQRNEAGQISKVLDHFGTEVISIEYREAPHPYADVIKNKSKVDLPVAIEDYAGRRVEYTWENEVLTEVKDVNGHIWKYEYNEDQILLAKIDPEQRRLEVGHKKIPGGIFYYCLPSGNGGGSWVLKEITDPETGVVTVVEEFQAGGVAQKPQCPAFPSNEVYMFQSLTYDDGAKQEYRYFYNARQKVYSIIEHNSDGYETERWIGSDGQIKRMFIGGELIFSAAKVDDTAVKIDPVGNRHTTKFDVWDQPIEEINPDNTKVTREYHPNYGFPTRITDENGFSNNYIYNEQGNLIEVVEAVGTEYERRTTYDLNEYGYINSVTYHGDDVTPSNTLSYTYDNYGNILTITEDHNGSPSTLTYADLDVLGNPRRVIDERGETWLYEYDSQGLMTRTTNPNSVDFAYVYDKSGWMVKEVDGELNETTYEWDPRFNAKSVADSYDNKPLFKHNMLGAITEIKDEEGKPYKIEYDRSGRMIRTIDGKNNETKYQYYSESDGENGSFYRTKRVDFPTFSQSYKYDKRMRLIQRTIHQGEDKQTDHTDYSPVGDIIKETDANGHPTYYDYDPFGNVIAERSLNTEMYYQYDLWGRLTKFTDRNGYEITYQYDNRGRTISEIRPVIGQFHYEYDESNLLTQVIDGEGQKITYEYDAVGLLKVEQHFSSEESSTPDFKYEYQYDKNGLLTEWSDGQYSGTFTRDKNGYLISEVVNYGQFSREYTYSYYKNGTRQTFQSPYGSTYEYFYDNANNLEQVRLGEQGSITVTDFDWYAPAEIVFPGGTRKSYQYTGLLNTEEMLVSDPASNSLLNLGYQYGAAQEILTRSSDLDNISYQYDDLYRVTSAEHSNNPDEAFTVDANSNLISNSTSDDDWIYNDQGQLIQKGNTTYEYDQNGNLIRKASETGTVVFEYDTRDRLVKVENLNGELIASYDYDPFDRRLKKSTAEKTTYYFYNTDGLVAEYRDSGEFEVGYGYQPDTLWGTDPLYMVQNDQHYYYHNDQLGTPYKITNIQGQVVWSANQESFGKTSVLQSSIVENNLRFPGQYYDAETELHYNFRRYYDSETGRYITPDPLGLAGGENLYAYVSANPINKIDPYGECGLAGVAGGMATTKVISSATGTCYEYGFWDGAADFVCLGLISKAMKAKKAIDKMEKAKKAKEAKEKAAAAKKAKEAEKKNKKKGDCNQNSFSSDTLVHTEYGIQEISELESGQLVWSLDETTGSKTLQPISSVTARENSSPIYNIGLTNGEVVTTTGNHPLYVFGEGWVEAQDVSQSQRLYLGDDGTVAIRNIDSRDHIETVYSLEIENTHTYFVGDRGVLVHNCEKKDIVKATSLPVVKKGTPEWNQAVKDIAKEGKHKVNVRTKTASDAKDLLNEARGNMDRHKNYTKGKYKKGYETHNSQNNREVAAGNDLPHIKWKDGKSGGHIYYDSPN